MLPALNSQFNMNIKDLDTPEYFHFDEKEDTLPALRKQHEMLIKNILSSAHICFKWGIIAIISDYRGMVDVLKS